MFAAVIRAAIKYGWGMLLGGVLVAILDPVIDIIIVGVGSDAAIVTWLQAAQTNWVLVVLIAAVAGFIAASVTERELAGG